DSPGPQSRAWPGSSRCGQQPMQVALEPPPALPCLSCASGLPFVVTTSGPVVTPAPGNSPEAWVPDSGLPADGCVVVASPESDPPQPAAERPRASTIRTASRRELHMGKA